MRIVPDRCTLVIVGAWNQAIFTPQFVREKIMPGPEAVQSGIEVGPGGFTAHHKGSHFRLSVRADRLIWTPYNTDEGTLKTVERAACDLLALLSVTPISGIGFNYGFDASSDEGDVARILELPDSTKLEQMQAVSELVSVRRRIRLKEQVLNIVIGRAADASVSVDLNFHKDVIDAATAKQALPDAIVGFKQRALELMQSLYRLEVK